MRRKPRRREAEGVEGGKGRRREGIQVKLKLQCVHSARGNRIHAEPSSEDPGPRPPGWAWGDEGRLEKFEWNVEGAGRGHRVSRGGCRAAEVPSFATHSLDVAIII